jgi:hypothetical protein
MHISKLIKERIAIGTNLYFSVTHYDWETSGS